MHLFMRASCRADGQMDGWMDGWIDGWTDGWMDGWMDGRTDECLGAWVIGQMRVLWRLDGMEFVD